MPYHKEVFPSRESVTPELVAELLRYDRESGRLYWRPRDRRFFCDDRCWRSWNSRYSGTEALSADHGDGYRFGTIGKYPFMAHRVIYAILHGAWPESLVDHKDGDRGNNRADNLRAADPVINAKNSFLRSDNKSGFPGVHWCAQKQKWQARLLTKTTSKHLGFFRCATAAGIARAKAQAALGFTDRHGEKANAIYS